MRANYLNLRRQAAGGVQPNLNLSIVKAIQLPIPTVHEQREIVGDIRQLMKRVEHMETESAKAVALIERLDQATLAKAFRGELVPSGE